MRAPPIVRYASLAGFAPVCHEVGVDARALLRRHDLDPALLGQPDAWAPAAQVAAVLEAAAALSGCATFGLRMAAHRNLSTLGPISLVLAEEPTLRACLATLSRFWPSYNEALRLRVVDQGAAASAQLRFDFGVEVRHEQAVELGAAVVCGVAAIRLGDQRRPVAVRFRHTLAAGADLAEHERRLRAPVSFSAEVDAVEFAAEDLDEVRELDDPMRGIYVRQYLATLASPASEDPVERVRAIIEDLLPAGRCSADRVATTLGVDRRTVQRWLGAEGESYGSIVDAVRRNRAERHLTAGRSMTDIAELLGFAEVSSFSRWFAGAYGVPPSRWAG